MQVIITENQADILNKIANTQKETTYYTFAMNVKEFIKSLLENPANAIINDFFKYNGITRSRLINLLLNKNIIEKTDKISDHGTILRKYNLSSNGNNDNKLRKLYILLFEKNLPIKPEPIDEDGGAMGGGATGCGNSGIAGGNTIAQPIFGVQRREIYAPKLETEATAGMSNIAYDAPAFGDKETEDHKNLIAKSVQDGLNEEETSRTGLKNKLEDRILYKNGKLVQISDLAKLNNNKCSQNPNIKKGCSSGDTGMVTYK